MKYHFVYFDPEKAGEIKNFDKALQCLAEAKAVMDAELLLVVEAAERGVYTAMCDASNLFHSGAKGVAKNYLLAKRYKDAMQAANHIAGKCPRVETEFLRNFGCVERDFGNVEAAKNHFVEAIKIMANEMPPDEWRFEVFHYLQDLVQSEMDVEQEQ